MRLEDLIIHLSTPSEKSEKKHPKCLGRYDEWNGDYTCDYDTVLDCDQCKYGFGRKDPEAKCNQL